MSIKVYLGRMGSGKTYEVVSVVILGALSRGRRVVTNIAGLDYEAIVEHLVSEGIDSLKVGELHVVSHAEVLVPEFWRTDKDDVLGINATIQPGDLVALDEIWRFWDGFANRSMPDRVLNFIRMHRHFTDEKTGLACDLALITQDVADIARRVRSVVEESYRMTKLTAVGTANRYRVDVFTGSRVVRVPLRQLYRTYDVRYFAFYKSHSQAKEGGAGPVEENFDGRGNILKGVLFKFIIPLGFLVLIGALFVVSRFFSGGFGAKPVVVADVVSQSVPSSSVPASSKIPASEKWRVTGFWVKGESIMIVADDGRWLRVFPAPVDFERGNLTLSVTSPDSELMTSYSGATAVKPAGVVPPLPQDLEHSK